LFLLTAPLQPLVPQILHGHLGGIRALLFVFSSLPNQPLRESPPRCIRKDRRLLLLSCCHLIGRQRHCLTLIGLPRRRREQGEDVDEKEDEEVEDDAEDA